MNCQLGFEGYSPGNEQQNASISNRCCWEMILSFWDTGLFSGTHCSFLGRVFIFRRIFHQWNVYSKGTPTYPWSIPQASPFTPKWKEFLHKLLLGGLGYVPGVCWKVLRYIFVMSFWFFSNHFGQLGYHYSWSFLPWGFMGRMGIHLTLNGSLGQRKIPRLPSLKLTISTWKWMVGRLVSFWEALFSAANY